MVSLSTQDNYYDISEAGPHALHIVITNAVRFESPTGGGRMSMKSPTTLFLSAPLLVLFACSTPEAPHTDSESPTVDTDVPFTGPCHPWSDPNTWPDAVVPGVDAPDACVVIPEDQCIALDVPHVDIASLHVQGRLIVEDTQDVTVSADLIVVDGAFEAGLADAPFEHHLRIELTNEYMSASEGIIPASTSASNLVSWSVACPDGPQTIAPLQPPRSLLVRGAGILDLHGAHEGPTWTQLAQNADAGENAPLQLLEPVSWQPGDDLLIATTAGTYDFDRLTIDHVDGAEVWTTQALQHPHLSTTARPDLDPDGIGVPLRAEVASLTRKIEIVGMSPDMVEPTGLCATDGTAEACPECSYKNCKCPENRPSDLYFEGAEIRAEMADDMGPDGTGPTMRLDGIAVINGGKYRQKGHYPVHFHMLADSTGSYIRRSVVADSSNRAIVVHSSMGVEVEDNVIHNILGHGYYLEHGDHHRTKDNRVVGNLASQVRACNPLDEVLVDYGGPGSFYMRDPENVVRDNTAAGGDFAGFYLDHQPKDVCDEKGDPSVCPHEFVGNTAHNIISGVWQDASKHADFDVVDFTVTKASGRAVWLHNRLESRVIGLRAADVSVGLYFASQSFHRTTDPTSILQDSLLVGLPDEYGTPFFDLDPNTGEVLPRIGVELYEGTTQVVDTTFADYPAPVMGSGLPPMGAVGRQRDLFFYDNSPLNFTENIRLVDANPVYFGLAEELSGGTATTGVYDLDGTLTGLADSWVVPPHPFFDIPGVTESYPWMAYQLGREHGEIVQFLIEIYPRNLQFRGLCMKHMDIDWLDAPGGVETIRAKLPNAGCARQGANVVSGGTYGLEFIGFPDQDLDGVGALDAVIRAGTPGSDIELVIRLDSTNWDGTVFLGTQYDNGVPLQRVATPEEVDEHSYFLNSQARVLRIRPTIQGTGDVPFDGEECVIRVRP